MTAAEGEKKAEAFEMVPPATEAELLLWIAKIREAPKDPAVRELTDRVVKDFCYRQLLNLPHSVTTLDWLAEALDRLREHEPVDEVLPLPKRAAHRPASDDPAIKVAWWVHLAATQRGYGEAEAKELAAEMFAKDVKTIERYIKAQAHWVAGINPEFSWADYFIGEGKPLPPQEAADKKSKVPVLTKRR